MKIFRWLMLSCLLAASGAQAEDGKAGVQDDLFRGKLLETDARKKHAWLEMLITIKNQLTPEQIAFLKSTFPAEPRP